MPDEPTSTPGEKHLGLLQALREAMADSPPHVVSQLLEVGWDGLEALEFADHVLFPDKLLRVAKGGAVVEKAIMLRVPRGRELRQARVRARAICAGDGVDPNLDPDLFKDTVTLCELQLAVRNATPPYEPLHGDPLELERTYDKVALQRVYGRLDAVISLLDPRPEAMNASEALAVIAAIAKERSIRPLVAFGPGAQRFFILTTASLLASSLGLKSSQASSEPSTPASSDPSDLPSS